MILENMESPGSKLISLPPHTPTRGSMNFEKEEAQNHRREDKIISKWSCCCNGA